MRFGGADAWCARFSCYLDLQCGGAKKATYMFNLKSGLKGKLYLGGELLIDDDSPKERELTPGKHFFEVEYISGSGGGGNELKSRGALALTVTSSVRRYRKPVYFGC